MIEAVSLVSAVRGAALDAAADGKQQFVCCRRTVKTPEWFWAKELPSTNDVHPQVIVVYPDGQTVFLHHDTAGTFYAGPGRSGFGDRSAASPNDAV